MDERRELRLHDYLEVLRRRGVAIAVFALVCGLAAFANEERKSPVYVASAELLFAPDAGASGTQAGDPRDGLSAEVRFANSISTRKRVAETLLRPLSVAVSAATTGDSLLVTARSHDAATAAADANDVAQLLIDVSAARRIEGWTTKRDAVLKLADALVLQREAAAQTDPASVSAIDEQLAGYRAQAAVLQASIESGQAGTLSLLNDAVAPDDPIAPKPGSAAGIGVVAGLLIAIAVAMAMAVMEDTIRERSDLDRASKSNVPFLGQVPRDDRSTRHGPDPTREGPALAEAFRSVRTSIQFLGLRHPLRSIQITSANASEGKTTVACHLAKSLAMAGSNVVLIDADLRRPAVHERFGLANQVGLTQVMLRQLPVESALVDVDDVPGLQVLCTGPLPGNAADFLWVAGSDTSALTLPLIIGRFAASGALVVVDGPPVLPVADAMTISRFVDATVVVVKAGSTSGRSLRRALEQLQQVEAPVIGCIFNAVDQRSAGYRYDYGHRRLERRRGRVSQGADVSSRSAAMPASASSTHFSVPNSVDNGHALVPSHSPPATESPASNGMAVARVTPPRIQLERPRPSDERNGVAPHDPAAALREWPDLERRLRTHLGLDGQQRATPAPPDEDR
ncbi:MAG: polysaccharide biosynthesis tyrosine autokinase [Acidimicrobiia bacterium]